MKITYLDHSGYVAEDGDRVLVFDYYKGTLPELPRTAKIYVFVSHVHYDHFNKQIFDWKAEYPDIRYILSDDVGVKGPQGRCTAIGPHREIVLDGMKIRTLRSTDEGVAFLVSDGERTVYHAGDLNWWHWEEECEEYNENMCRIFQSEIGRIEGEAIDVAFLPLDPRQEEQYAWGFDYFMRHTRTSCVFPMHMWGQYEICDRLAADPLSEPYRDRVMRVNRTQQTFDVTMKVNRTQQTFGVTL